MNRYILCIILVTCLLILCCGCVTELEAKKTQWSDDIHGIVIDKRVDSWGQAVKAMDYVVIMHDDKGYYEAVVTFQKYASINIGDRL